MPDHQTPKPSCPRRRAAALEYVPGRDVAPRLVARGDGFIAEQILAVARAHGIPVHEDPGLVDVLSRLDLEERIPPELYIVVAEILAFIFRAQHQARALAAPRT